MAAALFAGEPRPSEFALFTRAPLASDRIPGHPTASAATGEPPHATASEVAQAAQRARAAQHAWGSMPAYFRLAALRRFPNLLDSYRGMVATVLRTETGVTAQAADLRVTEVARECQKVTDTGVKALRPVKQRSGLRVRSVSHREPVGLVGVLAGPANSFDPATAVAILLAGNGLLIVADGTTGHGVRLLGQLCDAARLPQDLVQFAVGAGLAGALLAEVDQVVSAHDEGAGPAAFTRLVA